jgi:uncharacterized protein DUF4058
MSSPFPGIDPFIESQKWRSFHTCFIAELGTSLTALVRPRYVIDVEDNVYLAREDGDLLQVIAPDVAVKQKEGWMEMTEGSVAVSTEPAVLTLPMMDPVEEHYLVVRSRDDDEVVTVIELLSPTNKRSRDGRAEYLNKRNTVLHSAANLVEIDLLRGGQRLPTIEPLPAGDLFAFITRVERRPKVEVYSWPLERRMPRIPIPLAEGDPDVWLDLQAVFDTTYDRAGYDYALKYSKPVDPPMTESQQAWVAEHLAGRATA